MRIYATDKRNVLGTSCLVSNGKQLHIHPSHKWTYDSKVITQLRSHFHLHEYNIFPYLTIMNKADPYCLLVMVEENLKNYL